MITRSRILSTSLSSGLALSLGLCCSAALNISISTHSAYATKLNATPLPSKKDLTDPDDGQKVDIPLSGTRWKRKADYREEDKAKDARKAADAKKAEQDQKQAGLDAVKAKQDQGTAYLKQKAAAIEENNKGVTFGQQGHWLESIQAHERAVQMDPTSKEFRVNLSAARTTYGQQMMAQNNLTSALSLFRKALIAAPENGQAGKNLVAALKKAGFNPSDPATRIKLGDQLVEANDLEGAYIEYNAALQLDPSAKSYVKMGDITLRYGQTPAAYNYYRQAITKDPNSGDAHRQIGFLQMAGRDYTGAAASLRKAIILNSNDTGAGSALVELWRKQVATSATAENLLGLAGALQLTNDFVGAESEYRKVQAIEPQNPGFEMGMASLHRAIGHQQSERHRKAAETLFSQGLNKEALSEINQAVLAEPRNPGYQFMLGQVFESLRDYRGAHQAYLTCVLLDPNNVEAAARIKQMESSGAGGITPDQTARTAEQVGQHIAGGYNNQGQNAVQQGNQQPQQQQQMQQQQMQQQQYQQQMQAQQQQQQRQQQQYQQQMGQQASNNQPQQPQLPQGMPPGSGQAMGNSGNNDMGQGNNKNMFEGGSGAPSLPNNQLAFRTHDESPAGMQAAQQAQANKIPISQNNPFAGNNGAPPVAQTAPPQAGADLMAKVAEAEGRGDFATAVGIIQNDVLPSNMQNPDVHHRLGMDLISLNKPEEAIPEFRLASALAPKKKEYGDDLNRAMLMRKQQMHAEDTSN